MPRYSLMGDESRPVTNVSTKLEQSMLAKAKTSYWKRESKMSRMPKQKDMKKQCQNTRSQHQRIEATRISWPINDFHFLDYFVIGRGWLGQMSAADMAVQKKLRCAQGWSAPSTRCRFGIRKLCKLVSLKLNDAKPHAKESLHRTWTLSRTVTTQNLQSPMSLSKLLMLRMPLWVRELCEQHDWCVCKTRSQKSISHMIWGHRAGKVSAPGLQGGAKLWTLVISCGKVQSDWGQLTPGLSQPKVSFYWCANQWVLCHNASTNRVGEYVSQAPQKTEVQRVPLL